MLPAHGGEISEPLTVVCCRCRCRGSADGRILGGVRFALQTLSPILLEKGWTAYRAS